MIFSIKRRYNKCKRKGSGCGGALKERVCEYIAVAKEKKATAKLGKGESVMSSVFGTSNNYFSFFFQSSDSNSYNINGTGSTSSMLGDYSLIKTGSYKKLLKAYYKTQGSDKSTGTGSATSKEEADSTGTLLNVKSDAENLKSAADALKKDALYQSTGKDESGNKVYDREGIKKAVKQYVSAYNSYLDTAGKVENTGILSRTLRMVKTTSANQSLLNEVGITIGKDNKLTLDEAKLDKAHTTTLSSLFEGYGSYGNTVSQKASESYKLANSAAYSNTHASSYTYRGSYSIMGTSNNKMDQYM